MFNPLVRKLPCTMSKVIFFDSWTSILRSFVITILAYLILIVMLRVSGKRTLSKMNAFDFIITIALGSSLATVALNKSVALVDGVLVFLLLIFLQFMITWFSVRIEKLKHIVSSQPSLLLYKGDLLHENMKKERISIEDVYAAARSNQISQLEDIDAVVLETTGTVSILTKVPMGTEGTLSNVDKYVHRGT